MLLNGVGIRDTVCDISHAMEIEGTDEETLYEASNLGIVMGIVSLSEDSNECSSKSSLVHLIESIKIIIIYIYLL